MKDEKSEVLDLPSTRFRRTLRLSQAYTTALPLDVRRRLCPAGQLLLITWAAPGCAPGSGFAPVIVA